jgi:Immunity protein 27
VSRHWPELAPGEVRLQGSLSAGITGDPDDVESRIRWLASARLHPLASAAAGWDWLFRDPHDGRLWEQTYPLGSLHGPGPRQLALINAEVAREKYGTVTARS